MIVVHRGSTIHCSISHTIRQFIPHLYTCSLGSLAPTANKRCVGAEVGDWYLLSIVETPRLPNLPDHQNAV